MDDFRTFAQARRAPATPKQPLVDPAGWSPSSLGDVSDWSYRFTDQDGEEIADAVAAFRKTGTPAAEVTRDRFPLRGLAAVLADVRHELLDGRGIVMMRNFPVTRMDREAVAIAYLGLGSYIGVTMMQNASGHVLGHVKDIGNDYTVTRGYGTRAELRFHADGCDYVGLLCLQKAKSGGESRIASSVTVYNKILSERPDIIDILMGDFYRTNNGEDEKPWFRQPVFAFTDGYFSAMGIGSTVEKAQQFPDVPKLTPQQWEAIKIYRDTVSDSAIDIPFEPGDIQFLNNYVMLHSRRSFEDWAESGRKRHLLRLWLNDPNGRPIPETTRLSRSKKGIKIAGVKPTVQLDAAAPAAA